MLNIDLLIRLQRIDAAQLLIDEVRGRGYEYEEYLNYQQGIVHWLNHAEAKYRATMKELLEIVMNGYNFPEFIEINKGSASLCDYGIYFLAAGEYEYGAQVFDAVCENYRIFANFFRDYTMQNLETLYTFFKISSIMDIYKKCSLAIFGRFEDKTFPIVPDIHDIQDYPIPKVSNEEFIKGLEAEKRFADEILPEIYSDNAIIFSSLVTIITSMVREII